MLKNMETIRALAIALFCLHSLSALANTPLREAHVKLLAAELVTDHELDPVYQQLTKAGQHTDQTLSQAAVARTRLETAREEFLSAFANAGAAEKQDFLAYLATRPETEVLIYDFEPISAAIPRIAKIREEQAERLGFPQGRSGPPAVVPRALATGVVEVDVANVREINGNGFQANDFNLSFDDGPNPRTSRAILASLAQWQVKVNYFQCGKMIAALTGNDSGLIEEMYRAGHGMENHSWDHPQLTTVALATARKQIEDTYAIIEQKLAAYNYRSSLFRFPYGSRNQGLLQLLGQLGVSSIMWNIDTLDWKYKDPAQIVELTRQQINQQRRGIILMHDVHAQTTLAVPHILQILGERGARIVKLVPRQ